MSLPRTRDLHHVLVALAKNHGAVPALDFETRVLISGPDDAIEFRIELPRTRGMFAVATRDLMWGTQRTVEVIDDGIRDAAARLRGDQLRALLDGTAPIDFIGDGTEPELDRCERMALKLAELSDRYMRRVEELRGKS